MVKKGIAMLDKFLSRTIVTGLGCLEWVGALYKSGYPQFWYEGKKQRGNRVIYKLKYGALSSKCKQ
jgi:hypothetical protein